MVFWQHNDDLSAPPEFDELVRRRPDGKYWESNGSKKDALATFWIRWKRETGKDYPHAMPKIPGLSSKIGFAGSRSQSTRRPGHYDEKTKQDADG